jgi:hypothetical protein
MIFEASIPRNLNRAKAKKDLDLYECIYNQYIHESKIFSIQINFPNIFCMVIGKILSLFFASIIQEHP